VYLSAVFEIMEQGYAKTISMEGCSGKFEVEIEVIAIGTYEICGDFTVVTLTTKLTKRSRGIIE